jgi:hypothetical protein
MGTTGVNIGAHDGPRQAEPDTSAHLAAQHLHAGALIRDGRHVLLIQDGTTAVEITADMGSPLAAAEGLQRLADSAADLADALRSEHRLRQDRQRVRGDEAWWEQ